MQKQVKITMISSKNSFIFIKNSFNIELQKQEITNG